MDSALVAGGRGDGGGGGEGGIFDTFAGVSWK